MILQGPQNPSTEQALDAIVIREISVDLASGCEFALPGKTWNAVFIVSFHKPFI
jgi:hypothetical protein